jgi:hypothetical protein
MAGAVRVSAPQGGAANGEGDLRCPLETTKFDVLDHLKTIKQQIAYMEAEMN